MPNRTMQPPVLKAKIRVMGEKNAKNLQTMREMIDSGNINEAKNVHEKETETFSEFGETSYDLLALLEEDQHEEYIGKITNMWKNIDDMKAKIQNHPWRQKHYNKIQHARQQRNNSQIDSR